MKFFYKVLSRCVTHSLATLALGLVACSGSTEFENAGGTSDEAEGIIAISNKTIAGVSQKGPFVTGSKVILRETAADGSLTPTGREYETTVINDKGHYKFSKFNLESQYILLSAEGYYKSEETEQRSNCPVHLNAISNINKREKVNINILTHFEYKRVIELVQSGKTFSESKKQASREILQAFGVNIENYTAENLNIFNTSAADLVLFNLSLYIDRLTHTSELYTSGQVKEEDCQEIQDILDNFAEDFADDGELSEAHLAKFAAIAYEGQLHNREELADKDLSQEDLAYPEIRIPLTILKNEYLFGTMFFTHYMEVDPCGEALWGAIEPIKKSFILSGKNRKGDYLLCNAYFWTVISQRELDVFTAPIKHEKGFMTDSRDGKTYSTVIFKHKGKSYEWMAENLIYTDSHVKYSKKSLPGSYKWTTAMNLNKRYMTEFIDEGLIDSLHQGICPDGWHISTNDEWKIMLDYLGDVSFLLDESWRIKDREFALAKSIYGVFFNKFDFNLTPTDYKSLETFYHTNPQDHALEEYLQGQKIIEEMNDDFDFNSEEDIERYIKYLDVVFSMKDSIQDATIGRKEIGYSMNIDVGNDKAYARFEKDKEKVGYIRCVKN